MDDAAQVSMEYLLLIAVGIAVILAGIGVALQLRGMADIVAGRVRSERNSTLALFVR